MESINFPIERINKFLETHNFTIESPYYSEEVINYKIKLTGIRKLIVVGDWQDSDRNPNGDTRQNFLNAVVEVETELSPRELLRVCMEVETLLGRVRHEKWGARTMDIDLLLYGDQVVYQPPELVVPHPLMQERNFVLVPFAEIAAEVVHPVLQQIIADVLRNSKDEHEIFASRERW